MVRAWYLSEEGGQEALTLEELKNKTGAEIFQFNADTWETDPGYAELKQRVGCRYEDVLEISKESLPNYDHMMKVFQTEHLHADREIRFVVSGGGFFDLRDSQDRWVRVEVTRGDLLILPAGLYHRFYLNQENYVKLNRLFVDEKVWKATNRPEADQLPVRQEYLQSLTSVHG